MKKIFILALVVISGYSYSQITYSNDWQGNVVAKDQYGNTQSTYSRDWQIHQNNHDHKHVRH